MDSNELVHALQDGDAAAGAFLISQHAPQLLRYVGLLAGDISETDRELICEQSVERAMAKIDQFDRTKGTLAGWLRGFVRYEVLEWRRRHLPQVELDEEVVEASNSIDRIPDDEDDRDDPSLIVAQLLEQLSSTDRLIVQLRDLEGLAYSAIATILRVKEEACRQRHKRAIERLKSTVGRIHPSTSDSSKGGEDQ